MIDRHSTRNPVEDIRTMGRLFPAADAAALADGETEAGAEYLVIAALDLPDGSARRAFERAGADPDAFSGAVRAQHGDALRSIGMQPLNDDVLDAQLPKQLTPAKWVKGAPSGHDLFRRVVKLVRKERSRLHGAYIVLVAAQTEHGTSVRAIRQMGLDPEVLARAARAEVDTVNGAHA